MAEKKNAKVAKEPTAEEKALAEKQLRQLCQRTLSARRPGDLLTDGQIRVLAKGTLAGLDTAKDLKPKTEDNPPATPKKAGKKPAAKQPLKKFSD